MSDTPEFRVKEQRPVAEDEAEAYELSLIENYTACFAGPSGDFVLKDLYHLCNVGKSCFVDAEFDPVRAAFKEGMRYVALRLLGFSGRKPFDL